MIIVSQNKKIITKSMELSIENTKKIMVESNCGKLYFLGEYKTEERAKEVLEEIYKKYSDWQSMRMIRDEKIQAKIVSGDNSKYFDVYIMPKE